MTVGGRSWSGARSSSSCSAFRNSSPRSRTSDSLCGTSQSSDGNADLPLTAGEFGERGVPAALLVRRQAVVAEMVRAGAEPGDRGPDGDPPRRDFEHGPAGFVTDREVEARRPFLRAQEFFRLAD